MIATKMGLCQMGHCRFPIILIFIAIYLSTCVLSFEFRFGKPSIPIQLSLTKQVSDSKFLDGASKLLASATTDESLNNLRVRIRQKLASYAKEVKLVHDLPSKDTDEQSDIHSRGRRDTIWADKLSSTGRRRRNYASQAYELSYLDAGLTHVVKRVYQLQKPSFANVNVTDLNVLTSYGTIYLVSVESVGEIRFTAFYKFVKNWDLEEVGRIETPGAVICEIFQIDGYSYVLPASYHPVNGTSLDGGSPLYRIDFSPKFRQIKVQAINTEFAKSISFWRSSGVEANDMILCVAPEKQLTAHGYRYKVEISCYRWQGGYFDLTYLLPAYNPQAISYTHIASNSYMCVANYQDDSGSTSIFSTIFKYSHKKGNYIPFQRIKTNGAKDCQYFRFDSPEQIKEHYLAIANYGQADVDGRVNYNVKSYIFKFGMGRMILFQSLTTFGAFQILPIHNGGKFLLIFAEMYSISIYQHNGWNFVKTRHIDFPEENLVNQFRMRPMLAENQTYFTVATPKLESHTGIYGLEFEPKNDYIKMSSELEEWCLQAVANVQAVNLTQLTHEARSVPNTTQPEIIIRSPLTFQAPLRANTIFTQSLEYNDVKFNAERSKSLAKLERKLETLEAEVTNLESILSSAVTLNGSQTISTPLKFTEWNVAKPGQISATEYHTSYIKDINIAELLKKLIFLNKNYLLEGVEVKVLDATREIRLDRINGKPVRDLLLTSSPLPQTALEDNMFQQNVIAQNGVTLAGHLNNVNVNDILTAKGDQHFQDMHVRNSAVSNLAASYINGVPIVNLINNAVYKNGSQEIFGNKNFTVVTTAAVRDDKLLSGHDVNFIYAQAVNLSNITRETFTGQPVFEAIRIPALHLENELLNGKYNLSRDFVPGAAPASHFKAKQWTVYSDTTVMDLNVNRNLNQIPIYNGRPDVVLKTSYASSGPLHNLPLPQQLWNHHLNSLRLENPARLDGMINGIDLKTWSQTRTIELNEVPLDADIIVSGRKITFPHGVTVQRLLHGTHDTLKIINESIPLNSQQLPCNPKSITFQNLHVSGNAQVNSINNGISPTNDWVRNRPSYSSQMYPDALDAAHINAPQKHFYGDIVLMQPSTTKSLVLSESDGYGTDTSPNVLPLLDQVLLNGTKLQGKDQIVSGKIIFNNKFKVHHLKSEHPVTLDRINFSDVLLTHNGQTVVTKSIFKKTINAKNSLKIKSKLRARIINDIDFPAALRDTLRTDDKGLQIVKGHLKFAGGFLTNNTLIRGTLGEYNVDELLGNIVLRGTRKHPPAPLPIPPELASSLVVPEEYEGHIDHEQDQQHIQGSLKFNNKFHLSVLNFGKLLNTEITPDQWGSNWITKKGNQEITTPFHFHRSLNAHQPQVVDNMVSDVDLVRLNDEILRKDQDNFLEQAYFNSTVFMHSGRICAKLINGFDVTKDFLRKTSVHDQIVTGKKTFEDSNWNIDGELNAPKLGNIQWTDLAQLTTGEGAYPDQNLHVYGNCEATLEPGIQILKEGPDASVNGLVWINILQNYWFRNENAVITEPIHFMSQANDNMLLELNGGTINGLIGGVDVNQLSTKYLSVSKDQDWAGNFVFQSQVCAKEIIANETHLKKGTLNEMHVDDFAASVLLDGPNQTISTNAIRVKQLSGPNSLKLTGRINGFNICEDMVRITGENHVRGMKEVEYLSTQNLQLNPDVRINGVSLHHWKKFAAKTTGDFKLDGYNRLFQSAQFNHLVYDVFEFD